MQPSLNLQGLGGSRSAHIVGVLLLKIKVWDLPTRVFHWCLVVCVLGLFATAQIGGEAMAWHFRLGYTVLSLLSFRIAWGFVGGHWSRFSTFLYKPSTVLAYLRGQHKPEHTVGHNPLGALSVFSLLVFLFFQVLAGLFSDDEISNSGPLTALAPSAWVSLLTFYHAAVGKVIVLVLVVLHIGAVFYYRFKKKEDLISPMLTGYKSVVSKMESAQDNASSRLFAAFIFAGCVAAVAGLLYWAA